MWKTPEEDVLKYINENNIVVTTENRDEVEQELNDTLFTCDSVTGNASGSYTFNAWTAEEYLCHNWELLGEALTELDGGKNCIIITILVNAKEWLSVLHVNKQLN